MILKTETILLGLSVIFAVTGLFYVFRAYLLLNKIPDDVLRAKAFLTKSFLHRTILLIFVVCITVAIHIIFKFAEYGYMPVQLPYLVPGIDVVNTMSLAVSMGVLAYIAHNLFRFLLSSRSRS